MKIPDNRIEFSFIPLKFHQFLIFFTCSGAFHFLPVKKPEIKDKGRLLTGTSWLKNKKFQESKVIKLPLKEGKGNCLGQTLTEIW